MRNQQKNKKSDQRHENWYREKFHRQNQAPPSGFFLVELGAVTKHEALLLPASNRYAVRTRGYAETQSDVCGRTPLSANALVQKAKGRQWSRPEIQNSSTTRDGLHVILRLALRYQSVPPMSSPKHA